MKQMMLGILTFSTFITTMSMENDNSSSHLNSSLAQETNFDEFLIQETAKSHDMSVILANRTEKPIALSCIQNNNNNTILNEVDFLNNGERKFKPTEQGIFVLKPKNNYTLYLKSQNVPATLALAHITRHPVTHFTITLQDSKKIFSLREGGSNITPASIVLPAFLVYEGELNRSLLTLRIDAFKNLFKFIALPPPLVQQLTGLNNPEITTKLHEIAKNWALLYANNL